MNLQKMQMHQRVGIVDNLFSPRRRLQNHYSQLFLQLPGQRVGNRLPRFEFPTWEFPMPLIGFTLWARRQQKSAIWTDQNTHRNMGDLALR